MGIPIVYSIHVSTHNLALISQYHRLHGKCARPLVVVASVVDVDVVGVDVIFVIVVAVAAVGVVVLTVGVASSNYY